MDLQKRKSQFDASFCNVVCCHLEFEEARLVLCGDTYFYMVFLNKCCDGMTTVDGISVVFLL